MLNKVPAESIEYIEDIGGAQAPSIDLFAVLKAILRRWKLITAITLSALIATYGVLRLVPARYKSTVEILVYDPQGQIDATVQKPISPFVEALNNDAMTTEINILKSKSVALRVASELGLDRDPEFRPPTPDPEFGGTILRPNRGFSGTAWFPRPGSSLQQQQRRPLAEQRTRPESWIGRQMHCLRDWTFRRNSYIINVVRHRRTRSRRSAWRRLSRMIIWRASRKRGKQALNHVATWLKRRVDDLQSQILDTESAIEKLKVESGIHDSELG